MNTFPHNLRWLGGLALAGVLLVLGFQAAPAPAPTADDGEKIYVARCLSCHQANGQGMQGVFPPLDGVEWVTGDKGRLIRLVLQGLSGETEVNGVVYSGAMPPWGGFLGDDEVAAVLTYIRSAWSNEASAVTAAEVAAVRAATASRTRPWTAAELLEDANTGIPAQAAFPNFLKAPADSTR